MQSRTIRRIFKVVARLILALAIISVDFAAHGLLTDWLQEAEKQADSRRLWVAVIFASFVVLMLLIKFLEPAVEHLVVDRIIYKTLRKRIALLKDLAKELEYVGRSRTLRQLLVKRLDAILGIDGTTIYIKRNHVFVLDAYVCPGLPDRIDRDDPVMIVMRRFSDRALIASETSELDSPIAGACLWPLKIEGEVVGFLRAGTRHGSDVLDEVEELAAVDALARLAAQTVATTEAKGQQEPVADHSEVWREAAKRLSQIAGEWFAQKFTVLQQCASWPAMRSNQYADHLSALEELASRLGNSFNGVYTLDATGLVLEHVAPISNAIRLKYNASEREYFKECLKRKGPIVCNIVHSADRAVDIVVLAAPRFDENQKLIGIVDAVVDIPSAPFSEFATHVKIAIKQDFEARHSRPLRTRFKLLLVDEAASILGATDASMRRLKPSLDSDPTYNALRAKLGGAHAASIPSGAINLVRGTPFAAVAIVILEESEKQNGAALPRP